MSSEDDEPVYPYDWPDIDINNTVPDINNPVPEGTYQDPLPGESNWGNIKEEENNLIHYYNTTNSFKTASSIINCKYSNSAFPYKIMPYQILFLTLKGQRTYFKITFENDICIIFEFNYIIINDPDVLIIKVDTGGIITNSFIYHIKYNNIIFEGYYGYLIRGIPDNSNVDIYIRQNKEGELESNIDFGLICLLSGYKNYGKVKNIEFLLSYNNLKKKYYEKDITQKLDGRGAYYIVCEKYNKDYEYQLANSYKPEDNESNMKLYRLKPGIGNMPFLTYIDFNKELNSDN